MKGRMDPNNAVVKLCMKGMEAEAGGRFADARSLFREAWSLRSDPFEASVAAHYCARHTDSAEETLRWNELALSEAEAAPEEQVRGFYPSLHLNLGHSHETLGDFGAARHHYARASEAVGELEGDSYGAMVRRGIEAALRRVAE